MYVCVSYMSVVRTLMYTYSECYFDLSFHGDNVYTGVNNRVSL